MPTCTPVSAVSTISTVSEGLFTSVRLRRGTVARTVRVAITTPLTEQDRIAPGNVLDAFVAAVNAGLLGPGTIAAQTRTVQLRPEHGLCADVLEARFSAIAPAAFAVLPAMVARSVPGARCVEIHELHDDERVLVVRRFKPDTEATILAVDWEITLLAGDVPCLRVEMVEPPSPVLAARFEQLLRDWATLLQLGAFPPPDGTVPAAALVGVTIEDREVIATLAQLCCGYGGFEALFEALDRIHAEQPIVRLSFADAQTATP